jgi:hypothetical protein
MATKSWSNATERRVAALHDFNEAVANATTANLRLDAATSALQAVDTKREEAIDGYKTLRNLLCGHMSSVGWTSGTDAVAARERVALVEKINAFLDEIDGLEAELHKAKSEEGTARSLSSDTLKVVRQKEKIVRGMLPTFGPDDAVLLDGSLEDYEATVRLSTEEEP